MLVEDQPFEVKSCALIQFIRPLLPEGRSKQTNGWTEEWQVG